MNEAPDYLDPDFTAEPVRRAGNRQAQNIYRSGECVAVAFTPATAALIVAAMNEAGEFVETVVRQSAEIVRLRLLVAETASRDLVKGD